MMISNTAKIIVQTTCGNQVSKAKTSIEKKRKKHLGHPSEYGKDKHAPIMPPMTGEVSRVAQTVRSHGEDDEAQELALIFLLTCHGN